MWAHAESFYAAAQSQGFSLQGCALWFSSIYPSNPFFYFLTLLFFPRLPSHAVVLSVSPYLLLISHSSFARSPVSAEKCDDGSSRRTRWPRSPALPPRERPTVLWKKQQSDPCLNSGKNKRQLMQPHYVNALCSYEAWPQLKMTPADFGQ